MKRSKNNIDTGRIIGLSRVDVGKSIDRSGVTVLSYLRNSSIQTGILLDLSHALKHNFFKDIASKLPEDFTHNVPENKDPIIEKNKLIAQLQEEIKTLKIENNLMKKALKID